MTKFTLIFLFCFSVTLFLSIFLSEIITVITQQFLSVFTVIVLISGAMSYQLYSYVDNIAKDISSDERIKDNKAYKLVTGKLTLLKKEILINAFLLIPLLVIGVSFQGLADFFPITEQSPFNWFWGISKAASISCFLVTLVVALVQFLGFLHATEYREIMS